MSPQRERTGHTQRKATIAETVIRVNPCLSSFALRAQLRARRPRSDGSSSVYGSGDDDCRTKYYRGNDDRQRHIVIRL